MNNSNYTMRFSRTAKEAFGHDISFDEHNPDLYPLMVSIFALGLIVGWLLWG